ncbi:MAG: SPOR domain-containing protein [Bacteroidetes bacterium]|nr:SPOR domain-containing protein [Bacteroidota bacterium]
MKFACVSVLFFLLCVAPLRAQDEQYQTQWQVKQAVEKKAEYHRLTNGEQDGYRIKIHFSTDRTKANETREKFLELYKENYTTYQEYQQPNFVVLIGDFQSKREAFEVLKKIQSEFSYAFIVKGKINVK